MGSWERGSTQPWGPTQGLTRTEWGSLPAVSRQRVDPYTGLWPLKIFSSPWLCLGFIFLTGCVRAISEVPKSCFVWPLQGKWPVTLYQNVFEVTSGLEPPESGGGRDVCVWADGKELFLGPKGIKVGFSPFIVFHPLFGFFTFLKASSEP